MRLIQRIRWLAVLGAALTLWLYIGLTPNAPANAQGGPTWLNTTVDSFNNVGEYVSLAVVDGLPAMSYYASTNQDLKYARFNGSTWDVSIVDSAGNVGEFTSLAVINGQPAISYYDSTNGDLKYARFNGSTWDITTVDSAGDVGVFTSLAVVSGQPAISYRDLTNLDLKYARFNGSTWDIVTVDSTGNVGEYNALAIIGDQPAISYYDSTNQNLKYASFDGSLWSTFTVDSTSGVGLFNSLTEINGQPGISYYDIGTDELKYARFNGSTWVIDIADGFTGLIATMDTSLVELGNRPAIAYYDESNADVKFTNFSESDEIFGNITDASDGSPLQNVQVVVTSLDSGTTFTDCTAANGAYSVTGLNTLERHVVKADPTSNACGPRLNYAPQYFGGSLMQSGATEITLTLGMGVAADIAVNPGGTISGVVLNDLDGNPVPSGAEMFAQTADGAWASYTQCTDAGGAYTIIGLPRNIDLVVTMTTINCTGNPSNYVAEYYNDAINLAGATLLRLTDESAVLNNINFGLSEGAVVRGTVFDAGSGSTTPSMDIGIYAVDGSWSRVVCSDGGNGIYEFRGVPTNSPFYVYYAGFLCGGGSTTYEPQYYDQVSQFSDATILEATASGELIAGIDFNLTVGGVVTGTVIDDATGEPLSSSVQVYAVGDGWVSTMGCSVSDGIFIITGVRYDSPFKVYLSNQLCDGSGYLPNVPQYAPGVLREADAASYQVSESSPSIAAGTVSLPVGDTLVGTITATDTGLPITSASVQVLTADSSWRSYINCTDSSGNYQVTGIPYSVNVTIFVYPSDCNGGGFDSYVQQYAGGVIELGDANSIQMVFDFAPDTLDLSLPPGGSVTGTVVAGDTGVAIPDGVYLYATGSGGSAWFTETVCTASDGTYTLNGIPYDAGFNVYFTGLSCLNAGETGYAAEYYDNARNRGLATELTVSASTPTLANINASLEPTGTISGIVTAEDTGTGLVTSVFALTGDGVYASDLICTDSAGNYTITGIPQDLPVRVAFGTNASCDATTYDNYLEEYYNNASDIATSTSVTVTSSTPNVTGIDAVLEVAGTINGLVQTEDLALLEAGITVTASAVDFSWSKSTCTDPSTGNYSIARVPRDVDMVVYFDSDRCDNGVQTGYVAEYFNNSLDRDTATRVRSTASEPDVFNVNAVLEIGGTISGTVIAEDTGAAVPGGVVVNAYRNLDDTLVFIGSTCTNLTDGTYQIGGLPFNQEVAVNVSASVDCGSVDIPYLFEYHENSYSVYGANRYTATSSAPDVTGVNFTLEVEGTLNGRVVDSAGNPVSNAQVAAWDVDNGRQQRTCTLSDGTYTVKNLIPGANVILSASKNSAFCDGTDEDGIEEFTRIFFNGALSADEATPIFIDPAGRNVAVGDLTLPPYYRVDVQVTDGTNPLFDVPVTLTRPETGATYTLCTDSSGAVAFQLQENINVLVSAGGNDNPFRLNSCDNTAYAAQFWDGTASPDSATPVVVNASTPGASLNFALSVGGSISGLVLSQATGEPITGQVFAAVGSGNYVIGDTSTDAFGVYSLTGLPLDTPITMFGLGYAGGTTRTYEFWQEDPTRLTSDTITLTAAAPNANNINFTLVDGTLIRGRILADDGVTPLANVPVGVEGLPVVTCTDGEGYYTISNVAVGETYFIWAGGEVDGTGCGNGEHEIRWYPNSPDLAGATGVIATDPPVTNIDLQLLPEGSSNVAPIVTNPGPQVGAVGLEVSLQIEATDPDDGDDLSYAATGLPDGLTIAEDSGLIAGIIAEGAAAASPYEVVVSVTDDSDMPLTTEIRFGWQVTTANIAPRVTNPGTRNRVVGAEVVLPIRATDSAGQTLTYSATGLPPGLRIGPRGVISGIIGSGADAGSPYTVAVTVTDNGLPPLSTTIEFTYNVAPLGSVVGAPTDLNVEDTDIFPLEPIFTWTHRATESATTVPAQWYRIEITRVDTSGSRFQTGPLSLFAIEPGMVYADWFQAAEYCDGVTCSVVIDSNVGDLDSPEDDLFVNGNYTWRVIPLQDGIETTASETGNFTISITAPVAPVELGVVVEQGRPRLTWADDLNISWYYIYIYTGTDVAAGFRFDEWYESDSGICDGVVCTLVPNVGLENGSYSIYFLAYNPAGSAFEEPPLTFTLDLEPPGVVNPLTSTQLNTGTPAFSWPRVPNATWHYIWIGQFTETGTVTDHANWYSTLDLQCDTADICTLYPDDIYLQDGTYEYWVTSWGPGGFPAGYPEVEAWANGADLVVDVSLPTVPVPGTPGTTIVEGDPTYTWDHIPGVSWYQIWVGPADYSETVHFEWHFAPTLGCYDDGICELYLDDDDQYLLAGDYEWYLWAANSLGMSDFSAAGRFTVDPTFTGEEGAREADPQALEITIP